MLFPGEEQMRILGKCDRTSFMAVEQSCEFREWSWGGYWSWYSQARISRCRICKYLRKDIYFLKILPQYCQFGVQASACLLTPKRFPSPGPKKTHHNQALPPGKEAVYILRVPKLYHFYSKMYRFGGLQENLRLEVGIKNKKKNTEKCWRKQYLADRARDQHCTLLAQTNSIPCQSIGHHCEKNTEILAGKNAD